MRMQACNVCGYITRVSNEYTYTYTCMRVMYADTYSNKYTYTYTCTRVMYADTYTCVYMYKYTCIHWKRAANRGITTPALNTMVLMVLKALDIYEYV